MTVLKNSLLVGQLTAEQGSYEHCIRGASDSGNGYFALEDMCCWTGHEDSATALPLDE